MVTASEKIRAYHHELARKKLTTLVYGVIVFACTLILIMLCSGDRFNHYLAMIGLEGISNREGGVYADCSLPENKSSPYCQNKENVQQKKLGKAKGRWFRPFYTARKIITLA